MANLDNRLVRRFRSRRINHSATVVLELLGSLPQSAIVTAVTNCVKTGFAAAPGTKIDPRDYGCADSFRDDYLAHNILRKYNRLGCTTDGDRRDLAISKFLESELACKRTAHRLRYLPRSLITERFEAAWFINSMRENIRKVLPSVNWDDISARMAFGPGSSTRLSRRMGDPYFKFGGIPEVTSNCAGLAFAAVASAPLWEHELRSHTMTPLHPSVFTTVAGDRITTVPKDAEVDRVICIQPDMNLYIQKGIGAMIRLALKRRCQIDLNDQRVNQRLAYEGSLSGNLVTIDLRSASDSISLELCRQVLPTDWYEAIEQSRTQFGVLPCGKVVNYHKVSSMGNGFTFELQSLIFWSACKSVVDATLPKSSRERRISVYGDDIIFPSSSSNVLVDLLAFLGFETNKDKTFLDGPFRESCGKHYFNGCDVSPFYVREDVDCVERLYWFHNQYILWLNRHSPYTPILWEERRRVVEAVRELVPSQFRYWIPFGRPEDGTYLGSVGLISNKAEAHPRVVKTNNLGAFSVRGVIAVNKKRKYADDRYKLRQLYYLQFSTGLEDLSEDHGEGISTSAVHTKVFKTSVYQWTDGYITVT